MTTRPLRPPVHQRGLTLVEMMVAVAIGVVMVTAMSLLFANNSRSRAELERTSQKVENGRFALELLSMELQHAGYFAEFDPRLVTLPVAVPDPCETNTAALKAAVGVYVQGKDDGATGVTCISGAKAGSDVLVVRRAATCVAGVGDCAALPAGAPAFQASSCSDPLRGELASGSVDNFFRLSTVSSDFSLTRRDCTTAAPLRRHMVRIYFVAANDRPGDGIPTLKRAELGASGFETVSLVQGVESLQVEYGMDTNGDGNPDVYSASPDLYLACNATTTPTCVEHWASVVAAKVFLLARSAEKSPGYSDAKVYALGHAADAAGSGAAVTAGPFGDAYKRTVFQEVVRLNNASGRRFSPS